MQQNEKLILKINLEKETKILNLLMSFNDNIDKLDAKSLADLKELSKFDLYENLGSDIA
jgi:hypothetical protein